MEANREEAVLVMEKARDAMTKEPYSKRPMELLRKAERMHSSDEVKKAIVDWQAISEVLALRHDARALLGASTNTTEAELKDARRRLSLRVHPDKNSAPRAAEAFQIVQSAFETTKAALVGGVLPPPGPLLSHVAPQPQWPQPAPAPPMPKIQITCSHCAQLLDVRIPPDSLRTLPGEAPPVFEPFPACCCYCQKIVHVCAQPVRHRFFDSTRGPWGGAQRQQPPLGGRGGGRASGEGQEGREPNGIGAGARRGGGAGSSREPGPGVRAPHPFFPQPPPRPAAKSAEQKAAERESTRQRAQELERASRELRRAAKLANERARNAGAVGGGGGSGGASGAGDLPADAGVGAGGCGTFVDLDDEPIDAAPDEAGPEAAQAAQDELAQSAERRKRRREEERERTRRALEAQRVHAQQLAGSSGTQQQHACAVVIDLEEEEGDEEDEENRRAEPQCAEPPPAESQCAEPHRAEQPRADSGLQRPMPQPPPMQPIFVEPVPISL